MARGGHSFELNDTLTKAAGAAASGVGRTMVAARINPGNSGLPVAKMAYAYDGGTLVVGLLLTVMGQYNGNDVLANIGEGIMIPGAAALAGDVAHDVNRKINPMQPPAAIPTRIMDAQIGDGGYGYAGDSQVFAARSARGGSFGGRLSEDF